MAAIQPMHGVRLPTLLDPKSGEAPGHAPGSFEARRETLKAGDLPFFQSL